MAKGMDELRRVLRAVPDRVQAEIRVELEKIAEAIVADMRRLVPTLKEPDPRRRLGALKDSIGWTWGEAPKGSISVGKVARDPGDRVAITIYAGTRDKRLGGSDAFYARWVEFGTSDPRYPAQPFFWPAYRANRRKLRPAITRAIKRAAAKDL